VAKRLERSATAALQFERFVEATHILITAGYEVAFKGELAAIARQHPTPCPPAKMPNHPKAVKGGRLAA